MRHEEVEVKMKGAVVDTVNVPVCENEDDLASLDLKLLLDCVNRQRKTDMMNAARGKHRAATPGKQKRYKMGMNILATITFEDGETGLQKLTAAAALPDPDARIAAMDKLINSPEVQAKVSEELGDEA